MNSAALGLVLWASIAASAAAQSAGSPAPMSPFRYDDDAKAFATAPADDLPARLKFIPLSDNSYLSFGGDLRERVESSDVGLLGFRNRASDTYELHRLLVHADLQVGPDLRFFAQFGNHLQTGRALGPAPTDVDRFEVQQAFVDVSHNIANARATLRVGRAEMSYDDGALIGLRDGPNVRQVWDGVRLTYVAGAWRWDAFAVRPVSVKPGVFDDGPLTGQSLEGVHVTVAPAGPLAADAFVYHDLMPQAALFGAAGKVRTDTFGLRLRARTGPWDASVEAIGQSGQAAGRSIRAFAVHADAGLSLSRLPWGPHLSVRADALSGGDPKADHVSTFNALYPNVAYSTEATIEAPANLIQTGVVLTASPTPTLSLQYTLEGLWRFSSKDAFYAAPLFPLVRPDDSNDRYSGLEQQLRGVWRITPSVTLTSAIVRFSAGAFIRRGGGSDETFGTTSLALRL